MAHAFSGAYANSSRIDNFFPWEQIVFLFIMPVFFTLSGILFKGVEDVKSYISMIRKKAVTILIPYVIFSALFVLMNQVGGKASEYNLSDFLLIFWKPLAYLWFLYILFFIFVLVGGLSLFKINIFFEIIICLMFFLITQYLHSDIYLLSTFGWAIFFELGILLNKYDQFFKSNATLVVTGLLSILSICLMFSVLPYSYQFNFPTIYNILPKILIDIFILSVYLRIPTNNMIFEYFVRIGKSSLIVYLVHYPVMAAVGKILSKFMNQNAYMLFLILLVIGWISSLLVIWLSNRSKIINFFFNPYHLLK